MVMLALGMLACAGTACGTQPEENSARQPAPRPRGLSVAVAGDGSFTVRVGGRTWLASVPSALFSGGAEVSTRILGRRTAPFHLALFLTASRMVLPKILVLTAIATA